MVTVMAQLAGSTRAERVDPIGALAVVVLAICGAAFVVGLGTRLMPRVHRTVRDRHAHRRRAHAAAVAEVRARAMMDALCPHGWRAEIKLIDLTARARSDEAQHPVALDWTAFEHADSRDGIVRRVWASSIREALDAMVADRRTDATLQQIEQAALAEGARWPDG
jgi:hypothetical protein